MQKKTLDLIRELEKNYYVTTEGKSFRVDNYTFYEWKNGDLLVEYFLKLGELDDDYIVKEEVISHDIDEVQWWINSGRDY